MAQRARPLPPSNADYDALFELTATPTLEVDEHWVVLRANAAAMRVLTRKVGTLAEQALDDLLGAELPELTSSEGQVDVLAQLPEGPTALRVRLTPRSLVGAGGTRFTVQLHRREGREAVDADRRAEASRMSLLDDVSHNLGTPLAIAHGYAQTLTANLGELAPEDLAAAAAAIERHAGRAVEELRALQARVRVTSSGAGTIPATVLQAWLRRMLTGPLASNGTAMLGETDREHITVDAPIARQGLLNLCQMALSGVPAPSVLRLDITREGRGTCFRISTDPPSPPDSSYEDTRRATRVLVEGAGGRYESDDEHGVQLLWLPEVTRRTEEERARIPVGVIEDDPDTAALIRASLGNTSSVFELVVDERSFAAGLRAVGEARPRILLLDQGLPDRLGSDGIGELHEAAPGMKVVLLSAYDRERWPELEASAGDTVWLEKSRVLADLGPQLVALLAENEA